MNLEFTVANDIGNSEDKMIIDGELFRQPSIVKYLLTKPKVSDTDLQKNIANLMDELVVHITSEAISENGLFSLGNKAKKTEGVLRNMNIKLGKKHTHDVPVIMTLGMIAGKSVQRIYRETNDLPENLSLTLCMSTAIPASEYTSDKAKFLEDRFTSFTHIVIVHVGTNLVTVTINFKKVKVTQEGVPALYALLDSNTDILKFYNDTYKKNLTPRDFRTKKILHVEIGDGTTEYIYTVGVNPDNDASTGEKRGVGHATEEALKLLKEKVGGFLQINRQQFMDILRDENHRLFNEAAACMELAKSSQIHLIVEDTQEKFMEKTGGDVDIVACYGGGSIQFGEKLRDSLNEFTDTVGCEFLWIPEEYAVDMNVRGLNVLNNKLFFKVKG